MVAFECFEERWKFPKAYHLFYDQFFKAAVGERRWKHSLDKDKPFGNSNTEAFALMILKNNYHAWMAQAHAEFNFENQYHMEIEARKRKNVQEGRENADEEDEDDDDSIVEPKRKSILDEMLPNIQYFKIEDIQGEPQWIIVGSDQGDPGLYLKATEFNEFCLQQARAKIPDSELQEYSAGIESLQCLNFDVSSQQETIMTRQRRTSSREALLTMGTLEDKGNEEDITTGKTTPAKKGNKNATNTPSQKRRKILKNLKRFTKKGDCRSPHQRGWSNEGHRYHELLTEEISKETQAEETFVQLYRDITKKIELKIVELAHPNQKNRYTPDRKTVWQL